MAGRIDVGKHHIIGGGPTSKKLFIESIKKQIGTVFFQQHFSQDEDINSGLHRSSLDLDTQIRMRSVLFIVISDLHFQLVK